MANEKDRVELRAVDESAESESLLYRLHKDTVEEVVQEKEEAVKIGQKTGVDARLVPDRHDELRPSTEPGVGSLIEKDEAVAEELWDAPVQAGRIPWGWIALVGCAFAAGILWSLAEVNRSKDRREEVITQAATILEKAREEYLSAEQTIENIGAVVKDFYDSRTIDELLRYVRHPERVRPLMEHYYSERPLAPARVISILALDPLTIQNRATFWMVSSELENGESSQVLVDVGSDRQAKVDWETSVCYQPMDWDKFAESRSIGHGVDFRVYVEPDNFYTYEFSDSSVYASYRLTALNGEAVLYGYAKRGSGLHGRIEQLLAESKDHAAPMILTLRMPAAGDSKRAVHIERLISPKWIFVDSPEVAE